VDITNRRLVGAYDSSPMWTRYVVASEERNLMSLFVSGVSGTDANKLVNTSYRKQEALGTGNAVTGSDVYFSASSTGFGTETINGALIYKKSSDSKWTIEGAANINVTFDSNGEFATFQPAGGGSTEWNQASSAITDSPSEVTNWTSANSATGFPIIKEVSLIPREQNGSSGFTQTRDTVNEFIRIHRKRAFLNDSSTEYDFFVDANGANILNSSATDDKVFVTYKKHIIDTTTGVVISSLDTDGSSALQQIPLEFFQYTAHAAYADFLRLDGQHDKAAFEEQKAGDFLAEELEKVDIINNKNSLNHKFSTYINTSSR
jgi:hypothetical protein